MVCVEGEAEAEAEPAGDGQYVGVGPFFFQQVSSYTIYTVAAGRWALVK